MMTYQDILNFWFTAPVRDCWFNSTPALDQEIYERFNSVYQEAINDQLSKWQDSAEGCVALVILLDQLPLNMFRGKAQSFASEAQSREVANYAINRSFDKAVCDDYKVFLYMPFMHSEDLQDQHRSIELYTAAGLTENIKYAEHHREIIRKFNRFPHRNAILNRQSTNEELAYLNSKQAFLG